MGVVWGVGMYTLFPIKEKHMENITKHDMETAVLLGWTHSSRNFVYKVELISSQL